jgi:diguanylate cyclase (GGDEF)-like protein
MPPNIWPKPFKYFEHVQLFLVTVCLVIFLVVATLFLFIYNRTGILQQQRVKEQARTYADLLLHTKRWNYDYGGVYVEKKNGAESNVYLKELGINPDVKLDGGKILTIRNHAIMAKEISLRSEHDEGARFRIISHKPLDPANIPDQFENEAIQNFSNGAKEYFRLESTKGHELFRYVIPLRAEPSCLECHAPQGLAANDILGAISVSIPSAGLVRETNNSKLLIIITAIVTIGFLITVTYFLTWRLVIRLDEVQKRLKKLATTDELTGLKNRRYVIGRLEEEQERSRRLSQPLCLISLDVDHFKKINDTFGHPFGDLVLQRVATIMRDTVRRYDELGRIGGEEFLVVAPGTEMVEAVVLAERLCQNVRMHPIGDGDREVTVTLSAGVAILSTSDDSADQVLKRADTALYRAKQDGRDRVVAL